MIIPSEIVRDYLINKTHVSLPSNAGVWPAFVGHITDADRDDACTVFDTTPLKDGRISRTGEVIVHWGIQVAVRSKDYETGWLKSEDIQVELCALHNEAVGSFQIDNATKTSASFIGVDKRRRNIFVSNYLVTIRSN